MICSSSYISPYLFVYCYPVFLDFDQVAHITDFFLLYYTIYYSYTAHNVSISRAG